LREFIKTKATSSGRIEETLGQLLEELPALQTATGNSLCEEIEQTDFPCGHGSAPQVYSSFSACLSNSPSPFPDAFANREVIASGPTATSVAMTPLGSIRYPIGVANIATEV